MENLYLLLLKNSIQYKKIKLYNKSLLLNNEDLIIDHRSICELLECCNSLEQNYIGMSIPLTISFNSFCFYDKLTFVLFECICYHVLKTRKLKVSYLKKRESITTAGISSSPLNLLCNLSFNKIDYLKFNNKFFKEIYHDHFRKIINGNLIFEGTDELSDLYDDVSNFLNFYNIDEQSKDNIAEVIVELVGNAGEHTGSDCLIDIDVARNYSKKNADGIFSGINIVIINFSDKLFGDDLKDKILKNNNFLDDRYIKVLDAYNFHSKYFNNNYSIDDFFNIAAFQHKISGREKNYRTGGTGLTKLIHSLEKRADAHHCYMVSGDSKLVFKQEYLEYNSDNWIGFNEENEFLNKLPDFDVFEKFPVYIPGTAFNLNFVLKESI